jgi:hypothetical protein
MAGPLFLAKRRVRRRKAGRVARSSRVSGFHCPRLTARTPTVGRSPRHRGLTRGPKTQGNSNCFCEDMQYQCRKCLDPEI